MPSLPIIILSDGEIAEGETIELRAYNPGDILFFKHPLKKFTVFSERNIKEDGGLYYYEEGFGDIYDSVDEDFIQVKNLIPGRLFAIFEYTDLYDNEYVVTETFIVKPTSTIKNFETTTQGTTENLSFATTLLNVGATWTFADTGGILTGNPVTREYTIDGYHEVNIQLDYSTATYDDGTPVVWETNPEDFISNTVISGGIGIVTNENANPIFSSVTEDFTIEYLAKKNLDDLMTLDVQINTASEEGDINAPLNVLVQDLSTYSIDFESTPDAIEIVEIDFGDGDIRSFFEVGFSFNKIYNRSGTYKGKYTVKTTHIDGSRTYRNEKTFNFTIKIDPFFSKWLRENVNSKFYNSKGWYDLSEAWGTQTDRLYNEMQGLIESLDVENIDDRFILSLAKTYGDFISIYERVGFTAFIDGKEDPFKYIKDYRFFERLEDGLMTQQEKKEFIQYIRTSRQRLQLKGTPASIERAIEQFHLDATVEELWVETFQNNAGKSIKDEVFAGDAFILNTGLSYNGVSSPIADNVDQVIANAPSTPYLEINTAEINVINYYTPQSEKRIIDGIEYVAFPIN
jgi:hypothetical protein